jgi:hypothetical protein
MIEPVKLIDLGCDLEEYVVHEAVADGSFSLASGEP